ncbi:MAG: hypothetical protein WD851_23535 [Pirellulales bacterium]
MTDTVENVTTPIRDNQAGTHSLDVTDRGTFTSGAGDLGLGAGGFENTQQGHATIVEVFTNKSTSFAGLAGVLELPPPAWDEDPIVIQLTGGRLDKSTWQRTITEDFDYEELNGQFAREGTIEDLTERTADSLESVSGEDAEQSASFASRQDGGVVTNSEFRGKFTEDSAGRRTSGTATGNEERHGSNRTSYSASGQGPGGSGQENSTSQSKSRRTGSSNGAIEIGPDGTTIGPIRFTGEELIRTQNGGSSSRTTESSSTVGEGAAAVTTKTLTAEGGTSQTNGEVTGHSSGTQQGTGGGAGGWGLGAGTSTANISATTDGETDGNGFFISSTVKTGTGTKETELIASHGKENAKQSGSSSGTVRTGRDAKTDLTVNGRGEGASEQTTKRVVTSANTTLGSRTHTSVTRTDTGDGNTNTDGIVKIEDGQTERTGSFNGKSDNDATVTYSHRGNFTPSGQNNSYESANGTLTSGVDVNFNGTSNSTNLDNTYTLTASPMRSGGEDSIYVTGWIDYGTDTETDEEYYKGQTTTNTISASDNTSGTSNIKDGELVSSTAGGSSSSTDTTTIDDWDYRAKDDYFSKRDNTWSHTTTTRTGADYEGNSSLSQAIVEAWASDYYSQSSVTSPWGINGTEEDRDTHTIQQGGYISQSASISGPEDKRRHTLAIDSAFESWVDNESSDTLYITDPAAPNSWTLRRTGNVTHDEKSSSSSYDSSHLADAAGLARDGKFSYTATTTESHSAPIPTESSYYYNHRYTDDAVVIDELTDNQTAQSTRSVRHTSENGSYFDLPVALGVVVRIQSGDYTIEERTYLTERERDYSDVFQTPYGTDIIDELFLRELTSETTTTGNYGPGGLNESKEFSSTSSERLYWKYLDREVSSPWQDQFQRYALTMSNDNGQISGHKYHRWQAIDATGTYEILDPIIDEDIFDGLPPTGPKGQTTKGEYTPETLDGGIFSVPDDGIEPELTLRQRLMADRADLQAVTGADLHGRQADFAKGIRPFLEDVQEFFGDLVPGLGQWLSYDRIVNGNDAIRGGARSIGQRIGDGALIGAPIAGAIALSKIKWVQRLLFNVDDVPDITDDALRLQKAGDNAAEFAQPRVATVGSATTKSYRSTFFKAHPELRGEVVVHHGVPQSVLRNYRGLFSPEEIHSLENLRGIPRDINSRTHLSDIAKRWNTFFENNPNPSRQQILDFATSVDDEFGHLFTPPVR